VDVTSREFSLQIPEFLSRVFDLIRRADQLRSRGSPAMYAYCSVEELHLEITTRCNAACPMCARNISGGLRNPYLPEAELSLEDMQRIVPAYFIAMLRLMYRLGNY